MLDIANFAEDNILHQPLSEALYDAAASFVEKAEGSGNKLGRVLGFFTDESENHAGVIFKLMKRVMKSVNCDNCHQSPCLDGLKLTRQNFTPGAKVVLLLPEGHPEKNQCVRRK